MRKVLSFLALGLVAILIFSCGDLEGERGPQGPLESKVLLENRVHLAFHVILVLPLNRLLMMQ